MGRPSGECEPLEIALVTEQPRKVAVHKHLHTKACLARGQCDQLVGVVHNRQLTSMVDSIVFSDLFVV